MLIGLFLGHGAIKSRSQPRPYPKLVWRVYRSVLSQRVKFLTFNLRRWEMAFFKNVNSFSAKAHSSSMVQNRNWECSKILHMVVSRVNAVIFYPS